MTAVVARPDATVDAPPHPRVRRSWTTVLLSVSTVLLAVAMLLPLVWMLFTSFKPETDIVAFPPRLLPRAFTLDHYVEVWQRIPFARLYLNTIAFAGGVTVLSLLFDSMTAYALARLPFRGRGVIFAFILVMLTMPFQVTLIPLYDLLAGLGWTDTIQIRIQPSPRGAPSPRSKARSA